MKDDKIKSVDYHYKTVTVGFHTIKDAREYYYKQKEIR